ncbi:ClpP/crotonase [Marasmius fiardii PR-910]|nr:ClpP/crotonase [Marasmius fiardii PR-910]
MPEKSSFTPPETTQLLVSFPSEHVVLLTFNRPERLNAMSPQLGQDLERVLDWFENEDELWAVIVTGQGKAFCTGMDLIAWNEAKKSGKQIPRLSPQHGFGSLSRRQSRKPIIAAVNGIGAYGGGTEIVLNCDIVVASETAKFALPEVKRGVFAGAGGIPRLSLIAGHQLASEMLLTGRNITAQEAYERFGFVNAVVPASSLLSTAISYAEQIIANSPDSVQTTKVGLLLAQKHEPEQAFELSVASAENARMNNGGNIKEGLEAFAKKRKPVWKNPVKL